MLGVRRGGERSVSRDAPLRPIRCRAGARWPRGSACSRSAWRLRGTTRCSRWARSGAGPFGSWYAFELRHAGPGGSAHPARAGRGAGVSRRGAQHRRRGAVLAGAIAATWVGLHVAGVAGPARDRRGLAARALGPGVALDRGAGAPQGPVRSARGHLDPAAQLRGRGGGELRGDRPAAGGQAGLSAERSDRRSARLPLLAGHPAPPWTVLALVLAVGALAPLHPDPLGVPAQGRGAGPRRRPR